MFATPAPLAHNSEVTDDAMDGRRWPIDPIGAEPAEPEAASVPDLAGLEDAARVVAEFADSVNRTVPVAPRVDPEPAAGQAVARSVEVTDDDRTRYGVLLDHAAERGLLNAYEYEVRLGELASATSVDRMRQIVTDLPAFAAAPSTAATAASRSRRPGRLSGSAPVSGVKSETAPAVGSGSRRANPWVLLGMLLVVFVAALVFFALYAEHLIHSHNTGMPAAAAGRLLSGLRL